ncbi:MAG: hypothetical protein JO021_22670, partial [Alphaproteobacteria bacterium]|nr:hypothetical protein [Alphaproteobacteria bacterium]
MDRRARFGTRFILLSTVALGTLLAGCSWFESTPEKPKQQPEQMTTDEPYPSLGDVPGRPTRPPALDREKIAQGLASDRQNAQYTEETIRRTPETPAPRPPVARAPTPAAPQVASAPSPAAAPPPPAPTPASPPPPPPVTAAPLPPPAPQAPIANPPEAAIANPPAPVANVNPPAPVVAAP